MIEKIDELRALLGLHDRRVVSVVALNGIVETTTSGIVRTFASSGDRAYVFVGPTGKMLGEVREEPDGSTTFTFRVSP